MKRRRIEFTKDEHIDPPKYLFQDGLRKVQPYYFEYKTFSKQRWYGKPLLEVFGTDFKDKPSSYYKSAILNSLIMVNGKTASVDYIVRPNDIISHLIHRHEAPILDKKVHPSGRYNHNSLVGILKAEFNLDHLSVINRLDKLTSGIVILAKNSDKGASLHELMERGSLHKEYICKVKGNFPDNISSCDAPIKTASFKLALNIVAEDGKKCKTLFKKIQFDGTHSYIKAMPITGRTHQIRVHLQHLGYPIVNDPLYNNESIWGPSPSSLSREELQVAIDKLANADDEYTGVDGSSINETGQCLDCANPRPDPEFGKLFICLHAFRYSGPGFQYETEMPEWASGLDVNKTLADQ